MGSCLKKLKDRRSNNNMPTIDPIDIPPAPPLPPSPPRGPDVPPLTEHQRRMMQQFMPEKRKGLYWGGRRISIP